MAGICGHSDGIEVNDDLRCRDNKTVEEPEESGVSEQEPEPREVTNDCIEDQLTIPVGGKSHDIMIHV